MEGWVVTEVTNVDPGRDRGGDSESETIPGGMVYVYILCLRITGIYSYRIAGSLNTFQVSSQFLAKIVRGCDQILSTFITPQWKVL